MALELKDVMAGVVFFQGGKAVEKPAADNYAVRPVRGGQIEKANGVDVLALLRQAFPGATFLWLSKPAEPAAPAAHGTDAGKKAGGKKE